jgi:hypothetical protein
LALGVECSYCHVGTDDRSLTDFEFPSDAKETKRIAREMVRMVAAINAMVVSLNRGPGQFELAAAAFRKSLEFDPDGRWAAHQLAEVEELIAEKEKP